MDSLLSLLAAAGTVISFCAGAYDVCGIVRRVLNKLCSESAKTVLAFLNDLGCRSDAEIRRLVEQWQPPRPLEDAKREELIALLLNLAHGARAQTTRGTPTSSFARCADLVTLLLNNLQPKRRKGQEVGPGWRAWKLERFLGMGAFGEVWLGRNPGVPKPRAFKFFTHPDARQWLLREQETLNQVGRRLGKHDNILELDNVVSEDQEYPFLVLEYVGGGSLEEWILSKPEARLPLDKRAAVEDVVRGLAQAHARGIHHRDLKPANVLLTTDPEVRAKIADFGLGEVSGDGAPVGGQASLGTVVGTGMYLPPEALDPFASHLPARDDVFAVGVLWYQLEVERLERPPYDFAEQLRLAGSEKLTGRLISRCLAHPDRRFADACALEDALVGSVPPDEDWQVPADGFDVRPLARAYFASLSR
jgi:tRNA A-37 threonylcarbamoyl transferase component Bud32